MIASLVWFPWILRKTDMFICERLGASFCMSMPDFDVIYKHVTKKETKNSIFSLYDDHGNIVTMVRTLHDWAVNSSIELQMHFWLHDYTAFKLQVTPHVISKNIYHADWFTFVSHYIHITLVSEVFLFFCICLHDRFVRLTPHSLQAWILRAAGCTPAKSTVNTCRENNSWSPNHNSWHTGTLLNRIITAQWEGMGNVGSTRYEPAQLPRARPLIRFLSRSTHSISKWIFRNLVAL